MPTISPTHTDLIELLTQTKFTNITKLSRPTQTSWYHHTEVLYIFEKGVKKVKSPETRYHRVTPSKKLPSLGFGLVAQEGK